MARVHRGLSTKRALRLAELLGATVRAKPATDEVHVFHPGRPSARGITIKCTKKTAPRRLVSFPRRLGGGALQGLEA